MLMRWDPWADLMMMRRMVDRLLEPWVWTEPVEGPDVSLTRTEDGLVVRAALPGVRPEDVEVQIRGDRLTLRAEVREERTVDRFGWILREQRAGIWERTFRLPFRVDARRAEAELSGGVLTVHLPKAEGLMARLKRRVKRLLNALPPSRRTVRVRTRPATSN
ncbi:MAG TPA: Hsp20/alpha crystallin family protein [Thermoflexia bacterium]|jgi:HSP20 family protein|nr:Hsp20/alpha crystallin family protein [Thermoflexia bacterium]